MGEPQQSDPGKCYVAQHPPPSDISQLKSYVEEYAYFLREEARVGHAPGVNIDAICAHFGVHCATVNLGANRSGGAVPGFILLSEADSSERQRFTQGHELLELLIHALRETRLSEAVWHYIESDAKEHLCDVGAAALLFPFEAFDAIFRGDTLTVERADKAATAFAASRTAVLFNAVSRSAGSYALGGWSYRLSKTQQRSHQSNQMSFSLGFDPGPPKKMRRDWWRASQGSTLPYMPSHKSASAGSVITQSYNLKTDIAGEEEVDFGQEQVRCVVEAFPVRGANYDVVTLIRPL